MLLQSTYSWLLECQRQNDPFAVKPQQRLTTQAARAMISDVHTQHLEKRGRLGILASADTAAHHFNIDLTAGNRFSNVFSRTVSIVSVKHVRLVIYSVEGVRPADELQTRCASPLDHNNRCSTHTFCCVALLCCRAAT